MKQLKDMIHDEPWSIEEYDHNEPSLECIACENKILCGTYYTSSLSLTKKVLHKCCGDLPLKFQNHPLHPEHILHIENGPSKNHWSPYCIACHSPCSNKYTYVCDFKKCNFALDVGCFTLKDRKIKLKCHSHPLVFHKYPERAQLPVSKLEFFKDVIRLCEVINDLEEQVRLPCNACGERHTGNFYQCLECVQYWISESCNSLMKENIKYEDHVHKLKLCHTYPENLDRKLECKVCRREFDIPCWIYCCEGCRFFLHARCGIYEPNKDQVDGKIEKDHDIVSSVYRKYGLTKTVKRKKDPKVRIDPNAIHFPFYENEYATSRLINDFLVSKQNNAREKIIHPSHPGHSLLLHNTLDTKSKRKLSLPNKCGGCLRPVAAPFYCCTGCNFFLHGCCVELNGSIQHPAHPDHKLVLCKRPLEIFKAFRCDICGDYCNGLVYQCEKKLCHFHIDVQCASLPKTIIHEAVPQHIKKRITRWKYGDIIIHEEDPHQLVLCYVGSRDNYTDGDICGCCRRRFINLFAYRCKTEGCLFKLCPKCVLVPKQVPMPRFHKHPYRLTFKPLPSQQEESYCDICENYLDPSKWFYSCGECDRFMHMKCIFSLDMPNPKLMDYNFPKTAYVDSHSHPLQLRLTVSSRCDHCANDAEDSHKVEHNMAWLAYKCDKDSYLIQAKCAVKYNLFKEMPE